MEKKLGGKFDVNVKACQIKAARAMRKGGSFNLRRAIGFRFREKKQCTVCWLQR